MLTPRSTPTVPTRNLVLLPETTLARLQSRANEALVLNIGNTRSSLILFHKGKPLISEKVGTGELCSLRETLQSCTSHKGPLIISSVVPNKNQVISELCQDIGLEFIFLKDAQSSLPLRSVPKEAGADLIANALGLVGHISSHKGALCFDLGTAFSVIYLSPNRSFEGGALFLGVQSALSTLAEKTAQLPHIKDVKPFSVIQSSTSKAIGAGTYWVYVGAMKEMARQTELRKGGLEDVVVTGGSSPLFRDFCRRQGWHWVPDFTLRSLALAADYIS